MTPQRISAQTSRTAPSPVRQDRRTRHRLRDLCDEVLASYRLARGADVLPESERREAREMLARIVPLGRI